MYDDDSAWENHWERNRKYLEGKKPPAKPPTKPADELL